MKIVDTLARIFSPNLNKRIDPKFRQHCAKIAEVAVTMTKYEGPCYKGYSSCYDSSECIEESDRLKRIRAQSNTRAPWGHCDNYEDVELRIVSNWCRRINGFKNHTAEPGMEEQYV